jgi:hypothetical protein
MKKLILVLGIVMLFGACNNGGILTITNIPSTFNGSYAFFLTNDGNDSYIYGGDNYDTKHIKITATLISNGRVSLPLWKVVTGGNNIRYQGNETLYDFSIGIYNSSTPIMFRDRLADIEFKKVTFKKGNATLSFNDGELDI